MLSRDCEANRRHRLIKQKLLSTKSEIDTLIRIIKNMNRIISLLTLGAIATITVLAYFTSYYGSHIYLDILSNFQVQYLLISLILLFILLLLHRRRYIYLGLFCCTILSLQTLTWFLPPNYLLPDQNEQSDFKVLIANVYGLNDSYEKVLNLVRTEQPDVAILMEVTRRWQVQLDTLRDLLPYSSGRCSSCNIGISLYSKQILNDLRIESFGGPKNSSIVAQVISDQQPITIIATHPFSPVKSSFFQSRNQQLDLISQYLGGVDHRIILAGDLNITMWSSYYRRLIKKTGLSNTRKGFGILPTWSTHGINQQIPPRLKWLTPLFSIPIDHCLVSKGLEATDIYTGTETGSDHLPLIIDLRITPLN